MAGDRVLLSHGIVRRRVANRVSCHSRVRERHFLELIGVDIGLVEVLVDGLAFLDHGGGAQRCCILARRVGVSRIVPNQCLLYRIAQWFDTLAIEAVDACWIAIAIRSWLALMVGLVGTLHISQLA